jgi:hypothetical protein
MLQPGGCSGNQMAQSLTVTVGARSDSIAQGITTELIYHTAYGQALPVVGVTVYDEDVASM